MNKAILIQGLGQVYRSDDRAGLFVIEELKKERLSFVVLETPPAEVMALLESWESFAKVIVIDSLLGGENPGQIYRWEATKEKLPTEYFSFSSHGMGLGEALELARVMKALPEWLMVYAVEGKSFDYGQSMTPAVEEGCQKIVREIIVKVNSLQVK